MLDGLDQASLNEIARMAWGSGSREGAAGGRGKIGVLVDANGKSRIIKYDTHLFSRSTADKNDRSQLDAANNLRRQLLSIANRNLNLEACEEILTVGDIPYYHASGVPDDVLEGSAIEILDWFDARNCTPQQTLKWAKLLSRQHADLLSDEDKAFEGGEYKVELKFYPASRHVVCTVDAARQRFRTGSYSDVVTENRTFTYSEKAGDKE